MSSHNTVAKRILGNLNTELSPHVKKKAKIVENFLKKFEEVLKAPGQVLKDGDFHVDIVHSGSAYEGLVIDGKVDFDITLMLGEPFVPENFEVSRDTSLFFTMKWKPDVPNKRFADSNGFLQKSLLRKRLFNYVRQCVGKVYLPRATFECYDARCAFKVTVKLDSNFKISVDLVPQIVFRSWGQCPDLKPLKEMPVCLQQCINTLSENGSPIMFFSLGIPNDEAYLNSDLLFNISFSLLEKKFFKANTDLRDMVRMVKIISKRRRWMKKYPWKAFHGYRMAIKCCEQIKGKDLWDGTLALLNCISQDLSMGTIDGYFVKNQVMKKWSQDEIQRFQNDIATVLRMDVQHMNQFQ